MLSALGDLTAIGIVYCDIFLEVEFLEDPSYKWNYWVKVYETLDQMEAESLTDEPVGC